MKNKKEIQTELKKLAPLLAELRKEDTGMKIPEHYFDYLTESVMEQVALIPKPSVSTPPINKQPTWYAFLFNKRILSGLAMILLLLTGALFFRNQPVSELKLVEISSEEAATYIAAHLEDFETSLFIDGDFIEEIEEIEIEAAEIDLYLDEMIEELDIETLEQLL